MANLTYAQAHDLPADELLAILVSGTNPDGSTFSLPATIDVSSLATQDTLAALNDKVPTKGAAPTANSTPVNVASDQTVPTSLTQQLDEANDKVQASLKASATNTACDPYFNGALSNSAQVVKAGTGNVYGWDGFNNAAAANVFIQIFDLAAASVVLGTTVPKISIGIANGQGKSMASATPLVQCANAISTACTATATGSGAPTTASTLNLFVK